ncbi:Uncharacterised protein [Klebsiella pneumoniae]|nr:Uncharacterised protein [Klebsiella pneumoniae]
MGGNEWGQGEKAERQMQVFSMRLMERLIQLMY